MDLRLGIYILAGSIGLGVADVMNAVAGVLRFFYSVDSPKKQEG